MTDQQPNQTVAIPLAMAAAISRYLGTKPFDEVADVLPTFRALIIEAAKEPPK